MSEHFQQHIRARVGTQYFQDNLLLKQSRHPDSKAEDLQDCPSSESIHGIDKKGHARDCPSPLESVLGDIPHRPIHVKLVKHSNTFTSTNAQDLLAADKSPKKWKP